MEHGLIMRAARIITVRHGSQRLSMRLDRILSARRGRAMPARHCGITRPSLLPGMIGEGGPIISQRWFNRDYRVHQVIARLIIKLVFGCRWSSCRPTRQKDILTMKTTISAAFFVRLKEFTTYRKARLELPTPVRARI